MAAISRRVFLGCIPSLSLADNGVIPSDLKRFRDPATEFEIIRYTAPSYSSRLAPSHLRSVGQRSNFLIVCSDRSGTAQACRLDIKSGEMRAIPGTTEVESWAMALLPGDRFLCCYCAGRLEIVPLASGRSRVLHETGEGWKAYALGMSDDAGSVLIAERMERRFLVRRLLLQRRSTETVLESGDEISDLRPRPGREQLLYRSRNALQLLDYGRKTSTVLKTDDDLLPSPQWSSDGRSLLYLCRPAQGRGVQLREHFPDSGEDKLVAPTSQFVSFACNRDGSVFAGVSGSKGSPYVLILLRATRRELTVAEHRASLPAEVPIFFTPDSQRIFYESDKSGKPAIYGVPAERLLEPTDA